MMKNFLMNEEGQGMVEYGLILALIAVAAIVALTAVGDRVKEIFTKIDETTEGVVSGAGIS